MRTRHRKREINIRPMREINIRPTGENTRAIESDGPFGSNKNHDKSCLRQMFNLVIVGALKNSKQDTTSFKIGKA